MKGMKPYLPSVDCICGVCGKTFRGYRALIRVGKEKYCSAKCSAEGKSRKPEIIAATPGTIEEIATRLKSNPYSVTYTIRTLCEAKRMHAYGLVPNMSRKTDKSQKFIVAFAAGPSPDPDVPTSARAALAYFYRKMVIEAMPSTMPEMSDALGLPQTTISVILRELRAAGKCYIKRWKRSSKGTGNFTCVYAAGEGKDAKPRAQITQKERRRRWLKKLERSGKIVELREKERATRANRKMRTQTGDPFINALFGTPSQRKAKSTQPGDSTS